MFLGNYADFARKKGSKDKVKRKKPPTLLGSALQGAAITTGANALIGLGYGAAVGSSRGHLFSNRYGLNKRNGKIAGTIAGGLAGAGAGAVQSIKSGQTLIGAGAGVGGYLIGKKLIQNKKK